MTPKEKADELIEQMYASTSSDETWGWDSAVACASKAVDEIIKVINCYNDTQGENAYWKEVRREIDIILWGTGEWESNIQETNISGSIRLIARRVPSKEERINQYKQSNRV